jgi:hypothetical protein
MGYELAQAFEQMKYTPKTAKILDTKQLIGHLQDIITAGYFPMIISR